jgi:hypothetical protein
MTLINTLYGVFFQVSTVIPLQTVQLKRYQQNLSTTARDHIDGENEWFDEDELSKGDDNGFKDGDKLTLTLDDIRSLTTDEIAALALSGEQPKSSVI